MSKSNVNPNHYKVAGRERQGEDIVQARHKQKHAQSRVRARFQSHARSDRPARVPGPPPSGAAPAPTAKQAASKAGAKRQGSARRGKRATAQKRPSSRVRSRRPAR